MMNKLLYIVLLISIGCQSEIYRDENGIVKCQEDVPVGFIGEVDGVSYKVVDGQMLKTMIKNDEDLRFICTTKITDMSKLFSESQFNGDISNWDLSNVTNMGFMFSESQFNGDISNWDVSNVTNMIGMFYKSQFNGDISKWDVSNVIDCRSFRTNTSWTLPIPNFTNCNPNLIFEEEELGGY